MLAALLAGLCSEVAAGADDSYRFVPGRGEERPATLSATEEGVRWNWVAPAGGWDTALVGVRVTAAAQEPWVELIAGSERIEQYLDPGAQGLRWLNLTSLRSQLRDGVGVEIRGHGVAIEPGPATVRAYANRLDLKRPILVLAPHPDDAEIAAFGLYAGRSATIVTLTSGNAGDANYERYFSDPAEQYLFKGYLRAVDSVTVPWQGGIPPERCYNLGYFDARLQAMRERPGEPMSEMYGPNQDVSVYRRANLGRLLPSGPRTNTWRHLVEDLERVLRKVEPALVVTAHPLLDSHADHQFSSVALAEALGRWKRPAVFLLYTNHASENLYPFGPPGSVMSLPPWPGPELSVQSVYSHPVDPDLQRRKLFALESMHDLRLSPVEQSGCGETGAQRRPDYPRVPAVDYLRRGPRSEETFFVFDRAGFEELVRGFLEQIAAGP